MKEISTLKAIQIIQSKMIDESLDLRQKQAGEMAISSLKKKLNSEMLSLITGVDENGNFVCKVVQYEKSHTTYGRFTNFIADVFRRLGIRLSDYISSYFLGHEKAYCKRCYYRANFFTHGIMVGTIATSLIFITGIIIKSRGV